MILERQAFTGIIQNQFRIFKLKPFGTKETPLLMEEIVPEAIYDLGLLQPLHQISWALNQVTLFRSTSWIERKEEEKNILNNIV